MEDVPKISVANFIESTSETLQISVLAGESGITNRQISSSKIQKLGLALAGHAQYVRTGHVQILGQSEASYLQQLDRSKQADAFGSLDLEDVPCVLVTNRLKVPPVLLQIADDLNLPLLRSPIPSSVAINEASRILNEALAPWMTNHGVLLGMYGIGVLILGDSGIGKSECALDLVTRGHRLVADDAVIIRKIGENIVGESPELTFEHLEIRGLGILNIRELFGVSAVSKKKQIELVIELKRWDDAVEIERLGLEIEEDEIFGVRINRFTLPVNVGRNLSTLIETAVRLYLLRSEGFNAAQKLFSKHSATLRRQ